MNSNLGKLLRVLRLEAITENTFVGQNLDLGWGRVFGGQVVGQALSAARQTVNTNRDVHSLHSYFLRPGDCALPITYEVDRIRDGKNFTTRRVIAIQNNKPIFNLSASFHSNEPGYNYQEPMPNTVSPEMSISYQSLAQKYQAQITQSLYNYIISDDAPIQFRYADPQDPLTKKVSPPYQAVWLRANGELSNDQIMHRSLLAYASDFHFLSTALYPHDIVNTPSSVEFASLDHSMWFHAPVKMDDWVLHCMHSIRSSNARGLVRGKIYDRQGILIASTCQEGLIRPLTTELKK